MRYLLSQSIFTKNNKQIIRKLIRFSVRDIQRALNEPAIVSLKSICIINFFKNCLNNNCLNNLFTNLLVYVFIIFRDT